VGFLHGVAWRGIVVVSVAMTKTYITIHIAFVRFGSALILVIRLDIKSYVQNIPLSVKKYHRTILYIVILSNCSSSSIMLY
jgi:hypothetical protein